MPRTSEDEGVAQAVSATLADTRAQRESLTIITPLIGDCEALE